MTWINNSNREKYTKLFIKYKANNCKSTETEEEIRNSIKDNPMILEDFVDYLADGGRVSAI